MLSVLLTTTVLAGAPSQSGGSPATFVVTLPSDARLYVDNQATSSTGSQRRLQTPPLRSSGSYTIRATVVRDGQVLTQERTVRVRGGQEMPVRFNFAAGSGYAGGGSGASNLGGGGSGGSGSGGSGSGGSGGVGPGPSGGDGGLPPTPGGGKIVQKLKKNPDGSYTKQSVRVFPDGSQQVISSVTIPKKSSPAPKTKSSNPKSKQVSATPRQPTTSTTTSPRPTVTRPYTQPSGSRPSGGGSYRPSGGGSYRPSGGGRPR
jgi:uncharacterized protein (TIGR03000 family)